MHNIAWSDEAFGKATLHGAEHPNQGPFNASFADDVTRELRRGRCVH